MKKKHHACIVKWRDSSSLRGWNSIGHEQHGVAVITSVGWLVRETKTEVTIATCISECGNVRDAVSIPREAVTQISRLKQYILGNE